MNNFTLFGLGALINASIWGALAVPSSKQEIMLWGSLGISVLFFLLSFLRKSE